jgi:murein L,D-transpeptidase YafK
MPSSSIPRALQYLWLGFFILIACSSVMAAVYKTMQNPRITEVRERVSPTLKTQLATGGFALGNPAYIRILKEERELELWMKP